MEKQCPPQPHKKVAMFLCLDVEWFTKDAKVFLHQGKNNVFLCVYFACGCTTEMLVQKIAKQAKKCPPKNLSWISASGGLLLAAEVSFGSHHEATEVIQDS